MDGPTMKERFQHSKIDNPDEENTVKEVEEVLAEEEIVTLDAPSSKSLSPTRQVWKPKVNLELIPTEDTAPVAPSDAPLDH